MKSTDEYEPTGACSIKGRRFESFIVTRGGGLQYRKPEYLALSTERTLEYMTSR